MKDIIDVHQKEISVEGRKLFIDLVTMDSEEGLLLTEVASVSGIKEATTWNHINIKNHDLCSLIISRNKLKNLKEQGIINAKANRVAFLPKEYSFPSTF